MKRIDSFQFQTETQLEKEQFRHQKLIEFASTIRAAAAGNIVNAIVTCALMAKTLSVAWLAAFGLSILTLLIWRGYIANASRKKFRCEERLVRLERQVIATAIGLGGLWGAASCAIFTWGNSSQAVFAGIIGAGMMSAGVISYRTIPHAAFGYLFAWLPGGVVGLFELSNAAAGAAIALLFCFLIVLGKNITATSRRYIEGWEREKELQKSKDTVQLLLHDFSEQGSDWLMEVDRRGRIANPCQRLAEALSRPLEAVDGVKLSTLLDAGPEFETLKDHFVHGRSFRGLLLKLTVASETRWWSLSARPVRDGNVAYRGVATDITAQKVAEERVHYLAHYDSLTDLPNRYLFGQRLQAELRTKKPVAVMYLDLDNFKFVNDSLGHPVGDKLLRAAAERINGCLTEGQLLARLSGDEFAILLPKATAAESEELANAIVSAMSSAIQLGDHDVVVGASIGVAISPIHGNDPVNLLRNADLALYSAKSSGRNRAFIFEEGMDEAARERRLIEMDLRNALGKDEMRLHYQPLVSTQTTEPVGYEALIRWEHPKRGIVMPSHFIPIAEETGLIVQLGEWVLRQAIEDLSLWEDHLTVSINLSPLQMRSPSLLTTLINAIAKNQVDPARICIEITESVLMQDSAANIETLHKLREIGVQIALDDFGTGYSSLNYLRSFPFSKIKIDRCFVDEIDVRDDCKAIVRSVVGLANSLGMGTTAEGVERQEQVEWLKAEGCMEVQGFLYSKAIPLSELTNLRTPTPTGNLAPMPILQNRDAPKAETFSVKKVAV